MNISPIEYATIGFICGALFSWTTAVLAIILYKHEVGEKR